MKRYAKGVLLLLLALAVQASAQTLRPFTIGDLLKVRRVSDPQLSPDGRWIAYTITDIDKNANRGIPQIYLVPTMGGEPKSLGWRLSATAIRSKRPRRIATSSLCPSRAASRRASPRATWAQTKGLSFRRTVAIWLTTRRRAPDSRAIYGSSCSMTARAESRAHLR